MSAINTLLEIVHAYMNNEYINKMYIYLICMHNAAFETISCLCGNMRKTFIKIKIAKATEFNEPKPS